MQRHFCIQPFIGFIFFITSFALTQSALNDASDMLILVNQTRSQGYVCGGEALQPVAALTLNISLNQAAQSHSNDMAVNNFLSHEGSTGQSFDRRIEAQGYVFSSAGENVAAGKRTVQDTLEQWLSSEGHCRNIMNPSFSQMGLGVAENPTSRYKVYWTQVFASPLGSSTASSNTTSSNITNSNVVFSNPSDTVSDASSNTGSGTSSVESQANNSSSTVSSTVGTMQTSDQNVALQATPQKTSGQVADELLGLINQARSVAQSCGAERFSAVSALRSNPSLMQAAQSHSSSMAENNFFAQAGLDGKSFDGRVEDLGYSFSFIAENIIAGRPTVEDVMASLLETNSYCTGLMSPNYTEIGIGFAENPNSQYRYYWTLTFAKPM